jgi:hypothetical protein
MRNPSPIMFRMCVFTRMLSLGVYVGRNPRFGCGSIQMKVCGVVDAISQILNGDSMRRIILAILEPRDADNTVAVGTSGIAAEGERKNFQRTFLPLEIEAINPPEHLILTRRSRENDVRSGNGIAAPERREPGLTVAVNIYI